MLLIEPLVYLMQYDRKNLKYLKASIKSVEEEVRKRKDEKKNPIGFSNIKLPGNLSFKSFGNLMKSEEVQEPEEEEENGEG